MQAFIVVRGWCQCGAVRYRVNAPALELYHCHCSMCRRSHGTLFASYATVPREALVVEMGEEVLRSFSSSAPVRRYFCGRCGCHLLLEDDRWPDRRWYTPGTCDGHPGHPVESERHIFVGSKVPWHDIRDGLPQREEF